VVECDNNENEEEPEKINFLSMIVIEHDSCFSSLWNSLQVFMCLVSTYYYIFATVFGVKEFIHDVLILEVNIEYWIELFFFIDIIKKFFTTYSNEDS